jgi:hypothetical protein
MKEIDFIYRNDKDEDFLDKDIFKVCYKIKIYNTLAAEIKIAQVSELFDFEFLITFDLFSI